MRTFFRFMAGIMFICMLLIEGFFDKGYIGFGIGMLMLLISGLAFIGCGYLGGGFEEMKE